MFVLQGVLLIFALYLIWSRRSLYKLSWKLPGPFALPFIGNALSMHPKKLHAFLDQLSRTYESPMRIWLGPLLIVFVTDAENAEIVLKSKDCLNKPPTFYKMVRDGLGVDGLFTLPANEWKFHRRLVSPTINQASVCMHLPIFNRNIRETISKLPTNGEFFDLLPFIAQCTMTTIVEAALGTDLEPRMKQQYLRQLITGTEIVSNRSLQPLHHFDFIWNFTDAAKRLIEFNRFRRTVLEQMLSNTLAKGTDSETFLGRLIEVSKKYPNFTSEDIYAETATIFAGVILSIFSQCDFIQATDSSATSASFLTLMLAMHPEHQEKVFQEVLNVMPLKNTDLTQTDLEQLKFTDLCIKESLRLFPTAPLIGRVANKPIKLSNGVEVPANVPLMFGIRQIHIQEKYFGPTANQFDPYRFLDDKINDLPSAPYYIPFSCGPRNCAGYHYAQVLIKTYIAHLIRNHRVTTNYTDIDQLQLVQNISLRLSENHMVKLESRRE